MEESKLLEIGVGGIFAIMVIKEVFGFVRHIVQAMQHRKNGGENLRAFEDLTEKRIRDLHDWHNVRDQDGVPRWFVRQDAYDKLEEAIEKLARSVERQARILERLASDLDKMKRGA